MIKMRNRHIIFMFLLFASCNNASNEEQIVKKQTESQVFSETKLFWHWEDDFTNAEKAKIKKYIFTVTQATFNILGNYPFDVHYYFERSDSKTEPIPWAHTERSKKNQGVRFYINPDFDYEILFADWTAPHEISHLSIPFVGRENSWFAEGYASYMQYQIMQELGIYTPEEVAEKYKKRIDNVKSDYSNDMAFIENANALRKEYNYPAMYWGGAKYFMHVDSILLSQEGKSLNALIKEYQSCCRGKDKNVEMLLQNLDGKLKKPVFMNLYKDCNIKSFDELFR